eukprot:TRINITY_DN15506_c0_g1_i1.p1 TRINITY_DN15506_c0_g1~~TRINITY_DN15506_c0_g1_i1.p1  ORF type:complete len:1653 (+),score=541.43 TRINITY_DN15506_c0_g1_i1:622-4959(+)
MPGECHQIPRDLWGEPFFPHVLTKEASLGVYFGGAGPPPGLNPPELPDGYDWVENVATVPSTRVGRRANIVEARSAEAEAAEMQGLRQACHRQQFETWKQAVVKYAAHFQTPLSQEYKAEKDVISKRLRRFSKRQLEDNGYGTSGLRANFDPSTGELQLFPASGRPFPYLSEFGLNREVLVSGDDCDPATIGPDSAGTISGETMTLSREGLLLHTTYEYLPRSRNGLFRVDAGPAVQTYQRIDVMLDELQRADPPHADRFGLVSAAAARADQPAKLGIINPGTALATCLFTDVSEGAAGAQIMDPTSRPEQHHDSDIARAARSPHSGPKSQPRGKVPPVRRLNASQQAAVDQVIKDKRTLTFLQGPPGTGKTTTAVEIACAWIREGRGPILCTAYSNKGTDNLAEGLWERGVKVMRVGACPPEAPWASRQRGGFDPRALREADVVCATCIGAGMKPLQKFRFPYVVVDEAAQIMEPAVLIPLSLGSAQVVMVGDQCQLPATVISSEARQAGLDISLFERMLAMGMEVHMLAVQYRMHPTISNFPSYRFYDDRLYSGVPPQERTATFLPMFKGLVQRPLCFVQVNGPESFYHTSRNNPEEARCVAAVVAGLKEAGVQDTQIGVITPYSAQVGLIRRNAGLPPGQARRGSLMVSTVDSFQGSEREVIILSLVRNNPGKSLGFVADWRRLNVSLTRAKVLCIVVGDLTTLCDTPLFRDWAGFHAALPAGSDVDWLEWRDGDGRGTLQPLSPFGAPAEQLADALRSFTAQQRNDPLKLREQYQEKVAGDQRTLSAEDRQAAERRQTEVKVSKKQQLEDTKNARLWQHASGAKAPRAIVEVLISERERVAAAARRAADDTAEAAVAYDIDKEVHDRLLGPGRMYVAELERKFNLISAVDLVGDTSGRVRLVVPGPNTADDRIFIVGPKRKLRRARCTFDDFLRFHELRGHLRKVENGDPSELGVVEPFQAGSAVTRMLQQVKGVEEGRHRDEELKQKKAEAKRAEEVAAAAKRRREQDPDLAAQEEDREQARKGGRVEEEAKEAAKEGWHAAEEEVRQWPAVGERVEVLWEGDWFPANVTAAAPTTVDVNWGDGTCSNLVPRRLLRRVPTQGPEEIAELERQLQALRDLRAQGATGLETGIGDAEQRLIAARKHEVAADAQKRKAEEQRRCAEEDAQECAARRAEAQRAKEDARRLAEATEREVARRDAEEAAARAPDGLKRRADDDGAPAAKRQRGDSAALPSGRVDSDTERVRKLFESMRSLPPWTPRRAGCCGKACVIEETDDADGTVKIRFEDGWFSWFPRAALEGEASGARPVPRRQVISDARALRRMFESDRNLPSWNRRRAHCAGRECMVEETDSRDGSVKLRFEDGFFSWFPGAALEPAGDGQLEERRPSPHRDRRDRDHRRRDGGDERERDHTDRRDSDRGYDRRRRDSDRDGHRDSYRRR